MTHSLMDVIYHCFYFLQRKKKNAFTFNIFIWEMQMVDGIITISQQT